MVKQKIKVFLYARVSTTMQIDGYSLDAQKSRMKAFVRGLLASDFTITDRRYIECENDTGYHHYAIDVAKYYELEE